MIKSRRMRLAGHVAHLGRRGMHVGVGWGKPVEKRPQGRPRHVWDDNIKTSLREVGWVNMVWIDLAQDKDQ
jgi:hypothetical protein